MVVRAGRWVVACIAAAVMVTCVVPVGAEAEARAAEPIPAGLWQPRAGGPPTSGSWLYLTGEAGGEVSITSDRNFFQVDEFHDGPNRNGLYVDMRGDQEDQGFEFELPDGQTGLTPGWYPELEETSASATLTGGTSCNGPHDWVALDRVEHDATGALVAVDLRWELRCGPYPDGSFVPVWGAFHWRASDPAPTAVNPKPTSPSGLWRPPVGATPPSGNFVYTEQSGRTQADGAENPGAWEVTPIEQVVPSRGAGAHATGPNGQALFGITPALDAARVQPGYHESYTSMPYMTVRTGYWGVETPRACGSINGWGWLQVDDVRYEAGQITRLYARMALWCDGSWDGPTLMAIHWDRSAAPVSVPAEPTPVRDPSTTVTVQPLSPSPSVTAQRVTVAATVRRGGVPVTTGRVWFRVGEIAAGSAPLDANGVATVVARDLRPMDDVVVATWEGLDGRLASSTPRAVVVERATPVMSMLAAQPTIEPGGRVTFMASSASPYPGREEPNGSALVVVDGVVLGEVSIWYSLRSVTAGFTVVGLPSGRHVVELRYTGNLMFGPSAASAEVVVDLSTPNQRFVNRSFEQVFGRIADRSGLAYWSGRLDRGLSRATFTRSVGYSTELRRAYIEARYLALASRPATSAEVASWLDAFRSGSTFTDLDVAILSSPAVARKQGLSRNINYAAYVLSRLYPRRVQRAELDDYVRLLNAGVSRVAFARAIALSDERVDGIVGTYYRVLLGRGPDAGAAAWRRVIQRGGRDEGVLSALLASSEYYRKASAPAATRPTGRSLVRGQSSISPALVGVKPQASK